MKYTLNEAITRINQTLNYPAITYQDISVFLDQAIAELNTSLHIDIDRISSLVKQFQGSFNLDPLIPLEEMPNSTTTIPTVETKPCWYDPETKKFKVSINNVWYTYDKIYAMYNNSGDIRFFQSIKITESVLYWGQFNTYDIGEFDLTTILPTNWITLFLIPYVCFKYSVRDGDNGSLFSEEFQQGFQQLQDAYDVPSNVLLSSVAELPAYTETVKNYLPNLNVMIKPKAIYNSMLHDRNVMATYGGVFDNGGWGI